MSAVAVESLTEGQKEALDAVHSVARASSGALTVDLDYQERNGYYLVVRVYLASASLLSSPQGIKLEDWEPIDLLIPRDFPYTPPIAWAGRDDFPELPHQADGSLFCVRVKDSDWDRTAGMSAFLRAVIDTYQHIALGTLQGHLQPWQFINSYPGEGCAVIKADLPPADHNGAESWRRWAVGLPVSETRIDIIEWLGVVDDAKSASDLAEVLPGELARIRAKTPGAFLIPAITVAKPVALEYCHFWGQLQARLKRHGVEPIQLRRHLAQAAAVNQRTSDEVARAVVLFRVAVDTEPATGQDSRFAVAQLTRGDVRVLTRLLSGVRAAQDRQEFFVTGVAWTRVYDGRCQSVLSRAAGRPTEKLAGKEILLLGCGGLGAPIAEHCVRSGTARLHIVDSGTVNPGVLSRQPYEDADIGQPKADVLARRLSRIRPQTKITASVTDIIGSDLLNGPGLSQYDLIIDATANRLVAAKIERAQRDQHVLWPALITVAISQRATHGVAAVTPRGATGAGVDLLRRLGLKACTSTALRDVYAAFFPPAESRLNFRPDTSCSDTTFIGSSTDMSALAAQLLHGALVCLNPRPGQASGESSGRSLCVVRLYHDNEPKAALVALDLPADRIVPDHSQRYEVRVDDAAMETISEYVKASVNGRTHGAGVTAGLLLGQFDSACRVAWVSQATGLPPESTASPLKIDLDRDDVRDFLADRQSRSGGMLTLIGFWHSHLGSPAGPSRTDVATIRETAASPQWHPPSVLLFELTVPEDRSVGESGSTWLREIHAETFVTGPDPA